MSCSVVFGDKADGRLALILDMDADEVGKRLRDATGIEQFESKGKSFWINPANVLWVEPRSKSGAASF